MISEVKYLLENRDKDAPDTACVLMFGEYLEETVFIAFADYRVYNKTLEYVKTFAKFNKTETASAVRECVVICSSYRFSVS